MDHIGSLHQYSNHKNGHIMKTHTHFDNNFVVTFGHNKIKQAKVFQTYLYITINNPFHHLPPQNIEKIKHSPVTSTSKSAYVMYLYTDIKSLETLWRFDIFSKNKGLNRESIRKI